jgi:hypothetical protein
MNKDVPFEFLSKANLIKDAIYKGGPTKDFSSEPISKLLSVGNQSGIRFTGKIDNPKLVVLYSTLKDPYWPDYINDDCVVYFGDNKKPGREIHDLPGNKVLRSIFDIYYLSNKKEYPPIFLFTKGDSGFDRVFKGLLKPGYNGMDESEDFIAIWKTKEGKRFQNYKAYFTILPNTIIQRGEIENIIN